MNTGISPLIFKKTVHLDNPSEDDRRADAQRIKDALALGPVTIPLSVLRKISLHGKGTCREFSCILGRDFNGHKIIDISRDRSYSIALDLGTTNLVALLYDNIAEKDILTMTVENPQIRFGSDILTRMHHAMTGNGEVYSVLHKGINEFISKICDSARIETKDIHGMSVAGNTVMGHFFLSLDISNIPVAPFVPVVKAPGFFSASDLALEINPEAIVFVFPNAGSYVGGDIVAGILASGMHLEMETSILIDVGTNAEIVIGNSEWMLVGAGAAGPALEEGISLIGKRASNGIIYDVEVHGSKIECKTFDHAEPEGICGSGMVSLLYEMYCSGAIDNNGSLNTSSENVCSLDGEQAFRISGNSERGLYVRQREINNFLKSKAAMFTLLLVLVRSVGIWFGDIKKVYVAGALGTGINANKAVGIGMLPEWGAETIRPLGNASLAGARMLLIDSGCAEVTNTIIDKITYKHMHDDPEFMKEFMGAVFIPHTDPQLLKA